MLCRMSFEERYDERIAQGMLEAGAAAGGLPAYLGITHVRFEPGRFYCTATVSPELLTPFGNAHGGVTAAIVDHVTGVVVYPLMERGQWAATTEFKLNLLTPVSSGTVVAEAHIIAMTRSRDSQRMADLEFVGNALGQYSLDNRTYPEFQDKDHPSYPQPEATW